MTVPRVLRAVAVVIAVMAVLDPAVTSSRGGDAVVAVMSTGAADDGAMADRVAAALDGRFRVVEGGFAGADATVLVGSRIPEGADWLPSPVFAVVPRSGSLELRLHRVDAPVRVPLDSRVPVVAHLGVRGGAGEAVDVELRAGPLVLDRQTVEPVSDQASIPVTLSAIPLRTGPMPLRVEAAVRGGDRGVARDLLLEVREERWTILFYDLRPSWMSTFVRRSLEPDPRFEVTSRVVTSPGLATDFGSPPPGLLDPDDLAQFDAIVVGAPEELSGSEVASLEGFLRRTGGSVALLLDRVTPGAHDALMGVSAWSGWDVGDGFSLESAGSFEQAWGASVGGVGWDEGPGGPPPLRAAEVAWPVSLPPGARTHLRVPPGGGVGREGEAGAGEAPLAGGQAGGGGALPPSGQAGAVVWSAPVGAGRLFVSGALDAWRFRDHEASGFEGFWQALLGEAAARTGSAVEVRPARGRQVTAPGTRVEVDVVLADAGLPEPGPEGEVVVEAAGWMEAEWAGVEAAGVRMQVDSLSEEGAVALVEEAAPAEVEARAEPLRLWPAARVGHFRGFLRVPDGAGVHRIVVRAGELEGETYVAGVPSPAGPAADDPGLIGAWVATKGGSVRGEDELGSLVSALQAALAGEGRARRWHPMRSAWWILPFALSLGGEWWWRRRRGLR